MKIRIEDIGFWIIIALIITVAIWKLIGSPTDTASIISIALFVAGSEILIWKTLFKIDKKTTIGFMKIRKTMCHHTLKPQDFSNLDGRQRFTSLRGVV